MGCKLPYPTLLPFFHFFVFVFVFVFPLFFLHSVALLLFFWLADWLAGWLASLVGWLVAYYLPGGGVGGGGRDIQVPVYRINSKN